MLIFTPVPGCHKNTFYHSFGTIVESLFFSSVDLNLDNVKKFYYLDKNCLTVSKQILATGQKNIEISKYIYAPRASSIKGLLPGLKGFL